MSNPRRKLDLYGKFDELTSSLVHPQASAGRLKTFIDLFCGVGGFHIDAARSNLKCVFASDIDAPARVVYQNNFGIVPNGDISSVKAKDVPDHDLLCAGFPCQPFSIIGDRKGFDDARGTLFFEIARILEEKRPSAFVLENVKQFSTADKGSILRRMLETLKDLGYDVDWRVLNALDYGLPQKRERVLIVGRLGTLGNFSWPEKSPKQRPLRDILEKQPDEKHSVSARIARSRKEKHQASVKPAIWHENKSGNVSSHPFSCALRAEASYNYLLVDGERRLTPREMFRLQGFPDSFNLAEADSQARKQAGNAVPVPMVEAVIRAVKNAR